MAFPSILCVMLLCVLCAFLQGCGFGKKGHPSRDKPIKPPATCREIAEVVKAVAIRQRGRSVCGVKGAPTAAAYYGPSANGSICNVSYIAQDPSKPHDGIPPHGRKWVYGSFTKVWTATAIMKLWEEGRLDIDKPAFKYMEPVYQREAKHGSLVDRFGPQIRNVTIRQLLQMRGSIADYDEMKYQEQHPNEDLGPSRTVELFGKSLNSSISPGTCTHYSSMSFVLLGLVLIGESGVTSWDQYNQNVWPKKFPEVGFGVHGTCSEYTDIEGHCKGCKPTSLRNMSCTNGFTCGNMVGPPVFATRFLWNLFNGSILKPTTLREMLKWTVNGKDGQTNGTTTCSSFANLGLYGLGLQAPANGVTKMHPSASTCMENSGCFPGHAGITYGFSSITAYDKHSHAVYMAGVANSDGNDCANGAWQDLWTSINPQRSISFDIPNPVSTISV